ncbi:MAG TPA: hypothetical protein VEZ55_07170 [Chitinophagaceae bacterium]|nr:hypothetical protein [Chitinophagaceae bacterium]
MVSRLLSILVLVAYCGSSFAQKIESIHFNLYTDSLKKGFYNYISVDAKLSDGSWQPLDTSDLKLTSNTGFFDGNDLFIDSSYAGDSVKIRATLKSNSVLYKEVVVYIRKRPFTEPLKTDEDIFDELRKKPRR